VKATKVYFFFYLAALMFVAKPFIGFTINAGSVSIMEAHSILAKSFSKRKPEDLNDGKAKANSIHLRLTNPPLLLTITALLSLLFPVVFIARRRTGNSFINELKTALVPAAQPYLLAGKLII
jgi:hypothetical protein